MAARARLAVLAALASALLLVGSPGTATAGGRPPPSPIPAGIEAITRWDVDLRLVESGAMTVTERITYRTGPVRHHGILRDVVTRQRYDGTHDRSYPFTLLSVRSETAPDQVSVESGGEGTTRLRIGDPDVLIEGTHTYEVRYRLEGVLNRTDAGDELYWNLVGERGWDLPVGDVSIRVEGPTGATDARCFIGPPGTSTTCDDVDVAGGVVTAADDALWAGDALTVAVAFPAGTFATTDPVLVERWSLQRAFALTPATVGGALVTGGGSLWWLLLLWKRVARDRRAGGGSVATAFGDPGGLEEPVPWRADRSSPVEFVPPEGLRPGQLGMLLDERADVVDVTATIVDLAVRGHLRIEQVGEPHRNPKKVEHRLVRLPPFDAELLPYEALLVRKLFGGAQSVELSSLKLTFADKLRQVLDAIEDDAVDHGWFPAKPSKVRVRWGLIGLAAVLVTTGVLGFAVAATEAALVAAPVWLASVALLISAWWMPRRTPLGTGLTMRANGFRTLIEESEAHRARWAEDAGLFTQYLPYAVVLGCTDRWAKTFEDLGVEPDTSFYVGYHALALHELSSSLDGFASSTASTMVATPGGSGGSGFSGGGFSGGGGGGGGGGSW